MNIIAVDDERIALQLLATAIVEAVPAATVHSFHNAQDALSFCYNNSCEIAFLDVDMGSMNGIVLAKKLKQIHSTLNVIFVTAHIKYATEALSLYISGYVMKPATTAKIVKEIENLRHPVPLQKETQRLWIQCFGNFEVFAANKPIAFRYNKTKELLAYLVDRGGAYCANGELIATLWGDTTDSIKKLPYLRSLRADLRTVFRSYGMEAALCQKRGQIAIVPSKVHCDYYLWQQGDVKALNAYRGEYMSQYSWGEMTLGSLNFALAQKQ